MIIRVPAIYLEDKETRALLDVMEQGFALILEELANWTNVLDPDHCPASVLPHMLFEEGWTEQIPLTEAQQRRLAKELPRLRKWRGTYKAIIPAIKIFTVEANKDYQVDIITHRPSRTFWIRVPWRMLSALDFPSMFRVVWKFTAANEYFGVVGIPDRMLLLNQAGALATVTQDLSWQEIKTWKVFAGPRLNAAGAVETVTEDTSWSETITIKTFIGPRLNGLSLKLNGTGRANEGPTSTQQQGIQHPGIRTYKRFVAPVAALNARGTVIEDVVDHGWDETITEHRFTGPRLNSPPTLTMTGQARLNAGPKTSEQVVVHHPVLEVTVKNDGGTLLNRGPTETRQEIINHPDVRTYKKFNPEAGMILNGKPVLGYMWKKELKEAV
ncbi:MAG: hypothetical protein HPY90_04440 [Syntrophothermus sp.]|uniref:phage tail protein n=1 Tax=Syntrophothermus sp. TaxID=2736299 RepID=UPI00257AF0BF|nr:phage tail protein [Syntrophothermus sp.]NSW82515.1 hypothetical protein [Syntrophothermus sp.]